MRSPGGKGAVLPSASATSDGRPWWPGDAPATTMNDNLAYRFPVSVKGVVVRDGRVILLRNERDEWELPGGKLEVGEDPEACVAREIEEELGLMVTPSAILDSWVYEIAAEVRVLIVTYGCVERAALPARLSVEHKELGWHALDVVDGLRMPAGYKRSIARWAELGAPRRS